MAKSNHSSPPRPFSVTLLALGVLSIAGLSLTRLILSIGQWQFIAGFPGVSPLYQAITGSLWAAMGLPLAWGLWRGLGWAPRFTRIFVLAYASYSWLDRLFLENRTVSLVNWPFAAVLTALLLAFVFLTLARRRSRVFFQK